MIFRQTRLAAILTTLCLVPFAASGCAAPEKSSIAQIEPYAGGRPPTIRPLQPPPARKPDPPRVAAKGGNDSWMPAIGISKRWTSVVVHHSANEKASPEAMRNYHMNQRGWDELGYHFVIGNGVAYGDGQVYVGNRWKKQMTGAHCKTPGNQYNEHGIGICLIGDLQKNRPTAKQMDSLARLVAFLTNQCGIPRSRVLTHGGITGKTACPGRHFSLRALFNRMDAGRLSASSR